MRWRVNDSLPGLPWPPLFFEEQGEALAAAALLSAEREHAMYVDTMHGDEVLQRLRVEVNELDPK